MSQQLYVADITKVSSADYSTSGQYTFMKYAGTAGQVVQAAASTDHVYGVLQNKPKLGEAAEIRILGTSKVVSGGTVTEGDYVTSNGSGQAVTTTTTKDHVLGIAMESAVVNDIFEIFVVNFVLNV